MPSSGHAVPWVPKRHFRFWAKPAKAHEKRSCARCGEAMTSNRYRRNLLRFVRMYRCGHCGGIMEQETRGYQGFHIGAFLTLTVPFLARSFAGTRASLPEIVIFGLVALLGFWPVMINWGRYIKSPVLARASGKALLPKHSGRSLFGRILGGESRFYGLLVGIASGLAVYAAAAMIGLMLARFQ